MSNIFSQSLKIVKDTPFITLYFVMYLIVLFLILPVFLTNSNQILNIIIGILILLLTSAFLAGWFGMIKTSIELYREEKKTPEVKIFEMEKLKNSFFGNVAAGILPVTFAMIALLGVFICLSFLSDYFFGRVDNIINTISQYANDQEALKTYLLSLNDSVWITIIKKGFFSYITYSVAVVYFIYWAASLYLNKNSSKNLFSAVLDSIKVIFKTFFQSSLILILIMILNFILIAIQGFFVSNVVISFIAMILRIYFAAYIIVLIFDLYGKNVEKEACYCNHGADGLGENKNLD